MRLRNKNTGEIGELHYEPDKEYHFTVATEDPADMAIYRSLAELNEEWEDYKPKEPLIKDEKIRKAIRAWAEANDINSGHYYNTDIKFNATEHRLQWIQTAIEFNDIMGLDNLEDGEKYTIDELCGEEE
mgnify:FL=1